MPRLRLSLADLYGLLALFFGAAFILVTPPFGVSDETTHYERSYEVATGALRGGYGLPAGMQALIDDAFSIVKSGEAVTRVDVERWKSIPLESDNIVKYPDPIRAIMRLQSPTFYPHLAAAMAVGVALGASPMALLVIGRFVSLIVGVALVRAAIRRAPEGFRPPLLLVGLLPTTVIFFSALNVDSLMIGLSFFYFALVADHASRPEARMTRGETGLLIATAMALGQFKTGYFLLPALALILPTSKFGSFRARLLTIAAILIPGFLISFGWALFAKSQMLGDVVFSTAPGNRVSVNEQIAWALGHPIDFLRVMWTTIFGSATVVRTIPGMLALGGWTNIPANVVTLVILLEGLLLVLLSGPRPPPAMTTRMAISIQLGIFILTTLGALVLLYLGWTGVGASVVDGFQGRYFLPLLPLLFAAAPFRWSLLAEPRRRMAVAIAAPVAGLSGMLITVARFYYA